MAERSDEVLATVKGKSVHVFGHFMNPSSWGYCRMELLADRVRVRTKFVVTEEESYLLLSQLQGAAYVKRPHPVFIAVGFATLFFFGLGLILLLLALFLKYRFLILHGTTVNYAVGIKGAPDDYLDFMDAVLDQAAKTKGAVVAASTAAPPAHAAAPSRSSDGTVMNCPSCGMEYRLPAGSAGKKFRCSSCKAVMQAPAEVS